MNTRTLLLALFLFSGVSGLAYQVTWTRMFALVLGTTVYAVATVLGVFMGGLALGSYLFGRRVDRPESHGMRLYAWLEIGIGAYAFTLPLLMALCDSVYRAVWPSVEGSATGQLAVRTLLACLVLLIPTTLMGGTLPALSRFLVRTRQGSGREIGNLYAINTLGALGGSFITGFFLLEWLGVRNTLFSAGSINLVIGLLALAAARRVTTPRADPGETGDERDSTDGEGYSPFQLRLVLIVFGVSGLASLALEVLWTRALMYFVSVDTWAFSAMLCTFLLGIGIGSFVMARNLDRFRQPIRALAWIEVLIGGSAALSILMLRFSYSLTPDFGNASFAAVISGKLLSSFTIMLIPAILMGAAFPLVSRIYVGAGTGRGVGRSTGTLYACNTIGAIIGSIGAGFVLIPAIGIEHAILVVASVYAMLGLLLFATGMSEPVPAARVWLGAGAVVLLVTNFLFEGVPIVAHSQYLAKSAALHRREGWKLVYQRENADASIAVIENRNGTRALNINGIVTAADNYLDMQVHRMLSHLPILVHEKPENALIVGFGMGSTVWGACQHGIQVDVVELLREEKNTAGFFRKVNHDVLASMRDRFTFIQGDGRNYLLSTTKRYDVISFNAIHPRFSANLYTRDFYAMCRERLTENGVICAWMTQNSMTESEWRMLCRTFVDVFPESSMWYCNPEHFCLIGQKARQPIDIAAWQRRMGVSAVAADLRDSNLANPIALLSRYMFGGARLREYVNGAALNTDDRPLIEFSLERKDEERPIIEGMVARYGDVLARMTGLTAEQRKEIPKRREAEEHVMRGQIEFWYPSTNRPQSVARSQIAHRKAFLMYPHDEDIRRNLLIHAKLRGRLRARAHADKRDYLAQRGLGRIAMELGELKKARQYLEDANERHPDDIGTLRLLALVYLFLEENDRSAGAYDRLFSIMNFQMSADDAFEQYATGVVLQRLGHAQGAQYKNKAIEVLPGVAEWFELVKRCALHEY